MNRVFSCMFVIVLLLSGCNNKSDNLVSHSGQQTTPSASVSPNIVSITDAINIPTISVTEYPNSTPSAEFTPAPIEDKIEALKIYDYSGMFSMAGKTDGAYTDMLCNKLFESFEADKVKFLKALSSYDEKTQSVIIDYLLYNYFMNGENETIIKDLNAELVQLYKDENLDKDILKLLSDKFDEYKKGN